MTAAWRIRKAVARELVKLLDSLLILGQNRERHIASRSPAVRSPAVRLALPRVRPARKVRLGMLQLGVSSVENLKPDLRLLHMRRLVQRGLLLISS